MSTENSHRNPSVPASHRCQPPVMAVATTRPQQPDWTCGVCGRVWRDFPTGIGFFWAEVRGLRVEVQQ